MKRAFLFLLVFASSQVLAPAAYCENKAETASSNQDLALLKEDVQSQRKQIVAANLQLSDAEAVKFWPVYDKYAAELSKINETRLTLIKQYAAAYPNVPDAEAQSLVG